MRNRAVGQIDGLSEARIGLPVFVELCNRNGMIAADSAGVALRHDACGPLCILRIATSHPGRTLDADLDPASHPFGNRARRQRNPALHGPGFLGNTDAEAHGFTARPGRL